MTSISAKIATKASGFLSKRNGLYSLKLVLTVALLLWLVFYLRSHDLLATLRQVRPGAILLALALLPLNLALQFFKWHYLLRVATRRSIRAGAAWFSLLAGFPLGLLTPGRWGELGRALFLPQLPEREVMALAALDKIFDLLLGLLFGAFALLYLSAQEILPRLLLVPLLALFGSVVILNLLVVQPRALKAFARLVHKHTTHKSAARALTRLSRKDLLRLWLLALLFLLTYALQFVLLLRGFVTVSFWEGFIGCAAAFFAKSLLPIALGDLGVREGATAFFFSRMGLTPHAAFEASLLLFVINLLLPSLFGLTLLWKFRTRPIHERHAHTAPSSVAAPSLHLKSKEFL